MGYRLILHGKTRSFQIFLAALGADRAADGGHTRLLFLARRPGASPEHVAAGRVWHLGAGIRRAGEFLPPVWRPELLGLVQDHSHLLHAGRGTGPEHRPAASRHGQPRGARRAGLQDAADLALCRRPGGGRRAVADDVCLALRRRGLRTEEPGPAVGPPAQRQPRQGAGHGRLGRAVGGADDHRDRADRDPVPLCRKESPILTMVERRPVLTFFSHLILILGVLLVVFPVYITVIGSTQTAEQITTSNP